MAQWRIKMADGGNILDSFLTSDDESENKQTNNSNAQNNGDVNLEDEFTKLLRDFIGQDSAEGNNQTASQQTLDSFEESNNNNNEETVGLDEFASEENNTGLNSFVTEDNTTNNEQSGGLDGFVSTGDTEQSSGLDGFVSPDNATSNNNSSLDGMITESQNSATNNENGLKQEEQELARAIANFQDGVTAMASNKNLKMPKTDYTEDMLKPNYKPSVGKKIAQYMLECWDIINRYDPENMKRLSPEATDEEYLAFAESVSDVYLQLSIISYVEILINIEICEVNYEQQKQLILKNKIKRELYEEYMELQERKNKFIQKLKEKNFPIDADKLINNYFRAAQKDADGAFEALTKNPAMFSRIEIEKLKPKFFGLIKVTPEDGIKMNQKIGKFIKKLKV